MQSLGLFQAMALPRPSLLDDLPEPMGKYQWTVQALLPKRWASTCYVTGTFQLVDTAGATVPRSSGGQKCQIGLSEFSFLADRL